MTCVAEDRSRDAGPPNAEPARPAATPTPGRADETALLESLRRGDETAYERLVRDYAPRLLSVIRRLVANEDDARDVLQETFVSAWKAIAQFQGESRLSTWLHRIAVNAALMRLRSKKARPEKSIDDLLPQFADDGHHVESPAAWDGRVDTRVEDQETRAAVREAIESLPESHRTVLVLRDVEGLSTDDTAKILDVTPNAVKVRLHRAHLALRTLLDQRFRSKGSRSGRPRDLS